MEQGNQNLDMINLTNKTALITGGSSGIGLATAKLFAKCNCNVILVGRTKEKLGKAVEEIGKNAHYIVADVSVEAEVKNIFSDLDKIDFLFTFAGDTLYGPMHALTISQVKDFFDVRFFGQYTCIKYAHDKLMDNGSIVLISGIADEIGQPRYVHGAAVDGAINGMVRSLALVYGDRGICVNAITPGIIETGLKIIEAKTGPSYLKLSAKYHPYLIEKIPLRRRGKAEEVAWSVLLLSTNKYITGEVLHIDGGWTSGSRLNSLEMSIYSDEEREYLR